MKDGESIAVTSLGKALHHLGCEISMLAMNTSKHKANVDRQPEELSYYSEIQTVEVDNQIRAIDAFKNLFTDDSYHISRFVSEEFQEKLIELLSRKTFDIIQLETLYLAPYLPIIRCIISEAYRVTIFRPTIMGYLRKK